MRDEVHSHLSVRYRLGWACVCVQAHSPHLHSPPRDVTTHIFCVFVYRRTVHIYTQAFVMSPHIFSAYCQLFIQLFFQAVSNKLFICYFLQLTFIRTDSLNFSLLMILTATFFPLEQWTPNFTKPERYKKSTVSMSNLMLKALMW